jgi:hypothetical protein
VLVKAKLHNAKWIDLGRKLENYEERRRKYIRKDRSAEDDE